MYNNGELSSLAPVFVFHELRHKHTAANPTLSYFTINYYSVLQN